MSWFARSINSFNLDNDNTNNNAVNQQTLDSSPSSPTSPTRGVKEDLTELTKTLTAQFWGAASFLAPPPPQSGSDHGADPEQDPAGIVGLQSDFSEISGKFKSGISILSNMEITKMASNLLQLGEDDEEEGFDLDKGVVGVTEEVVAFVRDIAMHPETWLDFPLPENEDDEDFYLSDAQQEHALAVEQLVPRLTALRIELCPIYMSEARFWEIYFVLLHPRLDKLDAKILSTPPVVKARASLAQELRKRTKPIEEDWSEKRTPKSIDNNDSRNEDILSVPSTSRSADVVQEISSVEPSTTTAVPIPATKKQPVISSENQVVDKPVVEGGLATHGNVEKQPVISSEIQIVDKPVVEGGFITHNNVDKQPLTSSEIQIVDKPVVEGGLVTHKNVEKPKSVSTSKVEESDEDDGDDWLKEESSEIAGVSKTTIPMDNEEDVSFSDLEEDDMDVPANFKKVNHSSDKDSQDWVQLTKSSTNLSKDANSFGSTKVNVHTADSKEPSDWLDVDDIEVA